MTEISLEDFFDNIIEEIENKVDEVMPIGNNDKVQFDRVVKELDKLYEVLNNVRD